MNYIEVHGAKKGRFTSSMAHYTVCTVHPWTKISKKGLKKIFVYRGWGNKKAPPPIRKVKISL